MPEQDPAKLQEQVNKLNESLNKVNDSIKDIGKDLSGGVVKGLVAAVENTRKLANNLTESKDISKDITAINKELNNQITKNEQLSVAKAIAEQKLNKAIKDNNFIAEKKYKTELSNLKTQLKLNESIEDQLRSLSQIAEEERRISEEKKKQNSLGEVLKKTLKDTLKPFAEMLTIVGILKLIVDGALRFNKTSVDIGKNLGYGADQADRVATDIKDIAQNSYNANITTANLAEAYGQIAEFTGFASEYSADTLETQVKLTKQFGLTAGEAASIYQYSVLTGKSSSQINQNMIGAFVAARNQLGVGIPFRATIAEAAKVSGELAANLRNNPTELVKAVAQAKAFGTSLEQINSQGDKLLDFESSIESQLKAQLLTGESLNLERARAAALTGDQITLAKELNSQGMTLNKFENMNVLAKRAYAEAIGLTSDQLADQLKKQQLAVESGKSLAQITEDEVAQAQERQSIQEKFNAAVLKLQDVFGNIFAGPVSSILEALTNMLPLVKGIAIVYGTIWTVNKGIAALEALKLGYGVASIAAKNAELTKEYALNLLKKQELATQIGIAAAWAVANWPVALLGLAAAGAVAAGVYALTTADDMTQSGYGKRTILSPEGSIALNDNDTIIAGTNLGGGGGGGTDLTPMIAAMNAVKASIDKLYTKEGVVNIDGKKVGTLLTQGSYKTV
jgi:ribosomal protein S8